MPEWKLHSWRLLLRFLKKTRREIRGNLRSLDAEDKVFVALTICLAAKLIGFLENFDNTFTNAALRVMGLHPNPEITSVRGLAERHRAVEFEIVTALFTDTMPFTQNTSFAFLEAALACSCLDQKQKVSAIQLFLILSTCPGTASIPGTHKATFSIAVQLRNGGDLAVPPKLRHLFDLCLEDETAILNIDYHP